MSYPVNLNRDSYILVLTTGLKSARQSRESIERPAWICVCSCIEKERIVCVCAALICVFCTTLCPSLPGRRRWECMDCVYLVPAYCPYTSRHINKGTRRSFRASLAQLGLGGFSQPSCAHSYASPQLLHLNQVIQ